MFWNGFYTRKVIFIQLQEFPTPPYCRCCSVTKQSDSVIAEAPKALKMHFWDPSQWDKMCFEYHRAIFHWKKWVTIFTFAYGQGRCGWPPPPLTVSLAVKYPLFLTTSLIWVNFRHKPQKFCERLFFKILDAGPDVLHIQVSPMSLVSQSVSLVCQSSCGYFSNWLLCLYPVKTVTFAKSAHLWGRNNGTSGGKIKILRPLL